MKKAHVWGPEIVHLFPSTDMSSSCGYTKRAACSNLLRVTQTMRFSDHRERKVGLQPDLGILASLAVSGS